MTTKIVHIKDKYDVYIGRGRDTRDSNIKGIFGNPFPMKSEADRDKVITQFREYFYKRLETDKDFLQKVLALKGKILACWCSPKKCHGDVIAEYLDNLKD